MIATYTHTEYEVPRFALMRAFAQRDLGGRSVAMHAIACTAAGICAGWLAARMPADSGGMSAAAILHFDGTLAVVLALGAIFRTIAWLDADAESDWCLQLVAAGGSRDLFVLSLPAATAAVAMFGWLCGAAAFAIACALFGSETTALFRVAAETAPAALLFLSAAGFACAAGCIARGTAGLRLAIALIVTPWIALWLTLPVGTTAPPVTLWRVLNYPPPRFFLATTIQQVSFVIFYCGVVLTIAVLLSDRRVARRT